MKRYLEPNEFEQKNLPFTVKRLSPFIGAELLDIDLKKNFRGTKSDLLRIIAKTYSR